MRYKQGNTQDTKIVGFWFTIHFIPNSFSNIILLLLPKLTFARSTINKGAGTGSRVGNFNHVHLKRLSLARNHGFSRAGSTDAF